MHCVAGICRTGEFKAPYALVVVLVLLVTAVALMAQGSVDSTAFKVGAVLAGGFVARAALAVSVGALNTAVVMVGGSMVLLLAAVFLLHADTFRDHAIEGVAVGTFTGALMVVGELLERHRRED